MLSWVFMVLAHCNNNLQIELSLHSDTLYWLGTNLCFYSLILLVSGEAANTKFYSLWFDSGLNPGLTVLQWIEPRTYCAWVDWTQDLLFSSGLNPGLTVLEWIEPRTYCARVDWTQDLLCSSGWTQDLLWLWIEPRTYCARDENATSYTIEMVNQLL